MPDNYNDTLNLPKTGFSMRAGLTTKEPLMLEEWEDTKLYHQMVDKNKDKPVYTLHDGPPYANGDIHMGTAMNKILKDFILRYKNMSGFQAPYVPGWDTHGLPIERQAIKKIGHQEKNDTNDYKLRQICREYALKYVDRMTNQFKRLGVLGEWENPYITLAPSFESEQIKIFGEMAQKGLIYKTLKSVYWCPNDRTALAEAEIEYEDDPCDSLYVTFDVAKDNGALTKAGIPPEKTSFLIWTTTTWTLPANVAVCLNADFSYAAVQVKDRYYIMASDLAKETMESCGIEEFSIAATFKGSELEQIECNHCYLDRVSYVVLGEHVTLESGTGCVHTAPGHGVEDFDVITQNYPDIPFTVPVDDAGILTAQAGQFAGLNIFDANPVIQKHLEETGHVLGVKHLVHAYAHCWRCHNPVIYRATEQWFCSIELFCKAALDAIEDVQWIPSWGQERMAGMVRDRNDWCISRQRTWGVPIPVFYCKDCGEYLINDDTIHSVAELFAAEGSDGWYLHSAEEILPAKTCCPNCGGTQWRKETDTMDVWFDAGSSHEAVLAARDYLRRPADLYLEGSDQYRGWFQSSLLTSVATNGKAPYRSVLSCGWVVDGKGRKMSKSLGNGIDPADIIKQYGADIVRLWIASSDYQVDVRISPEILKQLSESYRKIRNTARFILGNISDFNPRTDEVTDDKLTDLDRWALAELDTLVAVAREGYDSFDFHKVYYHVHRFCVVHMSNFYLDIAKDRLYITPKSGELRRAAQTTMFRILVALTEILAPILSFSTQEIWGFIPDFEGKEKYVVLHEIPQAGRYPLSKEEKEKWERIVSVSADVKKVLEEARTQKMIGSSLEARVVLHCADDQLRVFLSAVQPELADVFIVSEVIVAQGDAGTQGEVSGLTVEVEHATGEKCERCWQYRQDVGSDTSHETLCGRCAAIIHQM